MASLLARCLPLLCLLAAGCNPTTRYEVLSFFIDGVPPPKPAPDITSARDEKGAAAGRSREVGYREHGPYGAKLCSACHIAGAFNQLVAPREEICMRCHEFKLDKKYLHGPLASGGCVACHDPHSSQYRYLLVSESDSFCFRCHEPQLVARNPVHAGVGEQCTQCHDAHMSDNEYLLR